MPSREANRRTPVPEAVASLPSALLGTFGKHNPPSWSRKLASVSSEKICKNNYNAERNEKGPNKEVFAFGGGGDGISGVYWDNLKEKWQGAEMFISWGVKTP